MDAPTLIQAEDSDHCLATWDRTLIQIWRHATTERAVANMCAVARRFTEKHPGGATILSIVEVTSEIPGAGARAELARYTRETVSRVACCAMVPEGGGFRSAIVRSVGASLGVLLGQSFHYQFADSVVAAIDLLAPHLTPSSGGRYALHRAVLGLRARSAPASQPRSA